MKKLLIIALILASLLALVSCYPSVDDLPILSKLEDKSDEWLTENLKGYSKDNLIDKWGIPLYELPSDNAWIWSYSDESSTITVYFNSHDRLDRVSVHRVVIPSLTPAPAQ